MDYKSTTEFHSKLVEGLVYKLKKVSFGRRLELNQLAAGPNEELRELRLQLRGLNGKVEEAREAAKLLPCTCDHETDRHDTVTLKCQVDGCKCREPEVPTGLLEQIGVLDLKIWNEVIVAKVYPTLIKWAVEEISGFTIDGQPATVETLLSKCPDDMVVELGMHIDQSINLSFEEITGFKLPGTSNTPETGQIASTSV